MPVYQPNIPTGIVNLSEDYQNIQGNFEQANIVFNVDHVPFSDVTAQKGYHTSIHFNPISTTTTNPPNNVPITQPATVAGYGQAFSVELNDGYDTDNAFFWKTGDGKLMQLTANLLPVVGGFSGYSFLPGPGPFTTGQGSSGTVMIQWGFVTGTHGSDNHFDGGDTGTVTFSPAFANKCISIWTQLEHTGSGSGTRPTNPGTVSVQDNYTKTSFSWVVATSSSSYTGFLWIAIGT